MEGEKKNPTQCKNVVLVFPPVLHPIAERKGEKENGTDEYSDDDFSGWFEKIHGKEIINHAFYVMDNPADDNCKGGASFQLALCEIVGVWVQPRMRALDYKFG